MEVDEQIRLFREFIEQNYYPQLLEAVRKGQKFLVLDFTELLRFNTELAEETLEMPLELLKAAELAVKEFELPAPVDKFTVRLRNLPASQKIQINEIRSKHLNKFLWMEGIIRQKSDVRPHVLASKFECLSCGTIITIFQSDKRYRQPTRCSCGRERKFKEISKELIDGQGLVLEEAPDELEGSQPKRINAFLKDDLVSPISERKCSPGSRVRLYGWAVEVPVVLQKGGQATKFDLIIEANYIEPTQEEDVDIQINEEELAKIKEIAARPNVVSILAQNIAPSIYGHDKIKEALVLQLAGGCRKVRSDGVTTRGDMHLLLIGDPGSAKSQLLKRISKIAPRARFTSGKGATAVGLCVAPDSLVMTNPGIHKIESFVNPVLENNSTVHAEGIWKAKRVLPKKILTIDENLQIKPVPVSQYWKLQAPPVMIEITTTSGRKLTVTPHTKLLTMQEGDFLWKESEEFRIGEHLATARETNVEGTAAVLTISLLQSDPIVYCDKKILKEMITALAAKYGTKRAAAKKLGWNENSLYHFWVKESARSHPKLHQIQKLAKESGSGLEAVAKAMKSFSLYRGKRITLPVHLNEQLLYFAGLVAGDGDISGKGKNVGIRFSNSSEQLIASFIQLSKELFNVTCNYSSHHSWQRPASVRFGSLLVAEILDSLGIPRSPKSHRIDLSDTLLRLPNQLLKEYLKGLFDTDGSVVKQERGSSYVELATTSEKLANKLPLALLRFGLVAKVRKKDKGGTIVTPLRTITPKHDKFQIEIKGRYYLEKFQREIGFSQTVKMEKLQSVLSKITKYDTNIDVIPTIQKKIFRISQRLKISSRQLLGYKHSYHNFPRNFSTRYTQQLTERIKCLAPEGDGGDKELPSLSRLAHSSLFWDKIKDIVALQPAYPYVYDLTVEGSHNFIVNGIVVHNTASVVKDEFLGGWSLEAGTLVLANHGFGIIDEMDKMGKDDRSALHEAMEQQQVSISKANIQATLRCETTVIAAANPKMGRFDPYDDIYRQIDLPPTLINRFDLIFPIMDRPSRERDEEMAAFILNLHQNPLAASSEIPTDLFKKYFTYIRQKINPLMTDEAIEELKQYYVSMRSSGITEGGVSTVPITARQLEALVRLSEAAAKVRLSKTVTKQDAQKAIEMIDYCLNQIAKDIKTGKIDIDKLTSGITATQRGTISMIKEIITSLEEQMGTKIIPVEQIVEAAAQKNIHKADAEDVLEKLRRSGDIFEPRRGFVQKL